MQILLLKLLVIIFLLGRLQVTKLCCTVVYGHIVQKVYKNSMDPCNLSLSYDSRGSIFILCLECHYPGVDILCFLTLLKGRYFDPVWKLTLNVQILESLNPEGTQYDPSIHHS
jgi:hypothetical protein